jgi:hypothetical protein
MAASGKLMATYVYDKASGRMVDKATGLPMLNQEERARPLQTPLTVGDLPGYASPITGEWVEGRRARKYDLQKHNCIDANDLPSPTGGKLKNERFASKHGLTHLLER